jgi:hypothetical protein
MKIILLALLTVTGASATVVKTTGLKRVDRDNVWNINGHAGWHGRLDCQSFFHYLRLTDGTRDVTTYLDPEQCEGWYRALRRGHVLRPVCVESDSLTSVSCPR